MMQGIFEECIRCLKCSLDKDRSNFRFYKTGKKAGRRVGWCLECEKEDKRLRRESRRPDLTLKSKCCYGCKQEKDISFFSVQEGVGGYNNYCKDCVKVKTKKYKTVEKEKRSKNPVSREEYLKKQRAWRFKRKYGLSEEAYENLCRASPVCPICNEEFLPPKRARVVDHDHITGEVRGMLCTKCNFFIGGAKDSVEILKSAITYLNEHNNLVLSSNGTSDE